MGRFVRRPNSYRINREDDPIYRTFIIEIIDLLNDSMGNNKYSKMISSTYQQGIYNEFQIPSYKSIEDIVSIINSVITRLERNPDFYVKKEEQEKPNEPERSELKPPDKVTLKWLWEYVPHSFWVLLGTILIGAFGFGVKFAGTDLYKSLTNHENYPVKSTIQPNISGMVVDKSLSDSSRSNIHKHTAPKTSIAIKSGISNSSVNDDAIYKDIDNFNKNYSHIDLSLECQNKPEYMEKYRQAQSLLNTIEAKAKRAGNKEILETFVRPKQQGIHRASNSCP